ncbi:hypothetical protein GH733_001908 [Mirounga leonina]|nr:hypothetical protein GH733_004865 [Mirounga leonina]KAF3828495.1 hypothetical protein GH733_001908 [Mirounga leonina]
MEPVEAAVGRRRECFRALCCKGPPPARPEYDLVCIGLTGSGKTSLLSKLCSESPENIVSTTDSVTACTINRNAVVTVSSVCIKPTQEGWKVVVGVDQSENVEEGKIIREQAESSGTTVVRGWKEDSLDPHPHCVAAGWLSTADDLALVPGADNIRKYWSRYYQGSQGVIFVLDSASSEDDLETARNELHSALQHPQLCTLPFLILANHQDKPAARSVQEVTSSSTLNKRNISCQTHPINMVAGSSVI